MKVINLFAGPGAGKSTLAAGLFYKLKSAGILTEYVTEYAKDLIWEERNNVFKDQLYITAKQNRRLFRLKDKIDLIVTDSPLILGINYRTPDCYLPSAFSNFVLELFNTYDNINFFINRKKKYIKIGRKETFEQAIKMDEKIKKFMISRGIYFKEISGDNSGLEEIFNKIIKLI